ncbi:uncharacterized protein LOC143279135 isoform X2 [Babylonia areolata]|uniref:uncharacterized protein LOC143279135 isoform X2 n=1 Tax=Babylonia areolata TaxID=304850 RepID=UPI003FD4BB5C
MDENRATRTGESSGRRQIVRNKKYAPATGIQSDFEKVLTSFVETKSVRYEDFAKIWREKKLSMICAGRQTDREAVEFMEECLKVAVRMFLPPYGFQARVGALYLLYGLYLTQPCLPKVKIRLMRDDWEQVKSLQEELTRQSHHDTNFILQKLLLDGAFYFCAASQEARSRYSQTEEANKGTVEVLREDRQRIDDLFTDETLEQMNMIHGRYHQQKVRVAGPDASRPDRSLDVLHDKFPVSVKEILKEHHEQWRKKESSRQGTRSLPTIPEGGESEEAESDPDYQPASSVGQRRARLKALAYRGAKNKQRYKHRSLATEASSSEEKSPSPKKKRGRPRGSKNTPSIQRATMATISEQEEESVAPMETDTLLHMPHFEDVPTEDKRAGRKRKGRGDDDMAGTSSTPTESNPGDRQTTATARSMQQQKTQPLSSPTKRARGRPPKPKAGPVRPVGRPRKADVYKDPGGGDGEPTEHVTVRPSSSAGRHPVSQDGAQPDHPLHSPTGHTPRSAGGKGEGSKARKGTGGADDGGEGSEEGVTTKVRRKAGREGKGAQLKIAPLQVIAAKKGKKNH